MTHMLEPSPVIEHDPVVELDRESWLFRRAGPGPHPLRGLIPRAAASGHAAPRQRPRAQAATATPHTPQAGPAALLDESEIARRIHELPSLPRALTEALRLVRRDDLDTDSCVRAIEQDAALAARVLRLANSPFYGACGRISSVGDAVRLLGLRTVAGVVVAVSMRGMLAQWRDDDGLFKAYWIHAVAVATAARELAPTAGADPDEAFLAGLLHDLGHLVLAVFVPDQARLARARALADDIAPRSAELGFITRTHDEVGAAVARHWQLPAAIVSAIAHHHAPRAEAAAGAASLAAIVHVADAIAHALDLTGDPAEAVPPVDDEAWRSVCPPDGALPAMLTRVQAGVALLASDH